MVNHLPTDALASYLMLDYAPNIDSLHGSFDALGENLPKFWDDIAKQKILSSTSSTSTSTNSTTSSTTSAGVPAVSRNLASSSSSSAASIPYSHHTQPANQPKATPAFSSAHSLLRGASATAAVAAASITPIRTASSSSSSTGSIMYRHAEPGANSPTQDDYAAAGVNPDGTYDESMANSPNIWEKIQKANVKWHNNKAHAWVRYNSTLMSSLYLKCMPLPLNILRKCHIEGTVNSVNENSTPYHWIKLTQKTGTSSSSFPIRRIANHHPAPKEHLPTEDDYEAAGVNRDGTYDGRMRNKKDKWKKITLANVKWHNNTAYAWVRNCDSLSLTLYLKFRPLIKNKLKTLGIKNSVAVNIETSPYHWIKLKPATSSTSSTSTSTSSQAGASLEAINDIALAAAHSVVLNLAEPLGLTGFGLLNSNIITRTSSTTSSSSSFAASIAYDHKKEDENQPNENDCLAAGVNQNRSYEIHMAVANKIWGQIQIANVKWHNKTAYAWVRFYRRVQQILYLICKPLPQDILKKLGIKNSVHVSERTSIYNKIPLTLSETTLPINSIDVPTHSQTAPLLGGAATGASAALITPVRTGSTETQRQLPQQPTKKRKHQNTSNEADQQSYKKARTSQQNRSQLANSSSSSSSSTSTSNAPQISNVQAAAVVVDTASRIEKYG